MIQAAAGEKNISFLSNLFLKDNRKAEEKNMEKKDQGKLTLISFEIGGVRKSFFVRLPDEGRHITPEMMEEVIRKFFGDVPRGTTISRG